MSNHRDPVKPYDREYSDRSQENTAGSLNQLSVKASLDPAEADHQATIGASLAAQDHSSNGVEFDQEEALRRFRTSLTSNILPELPSLAGFHLCWVPMHSNNMFDTVDHRKRIGYSFVRPDELPQFKLSNSNRAAEFEGALSFNEMVMMKLPNHLYQLYAIDTHHTQPNEQERVIKQRIADLSEATDANGRSLVTIEGDRGAVDGFNRLARKTKDPVFQP